MKIIYCIIILLVYSCNSKIRKEDLTDDSYVKWKEILEYQNYINDQFQLPEDIINCQIEYSESHSNKEIDYTKNALYAFSDKYKIQVPVSMEFYEWLLNQNIVNEWSIKQETISDIADNGIPETYNDYVELLKKNLSISYIGKIDTNTYNYKSFLILLDYSPSSDLHFSKKKMLQINYVNNKITSIVKVGYLITDGLGLLIDWTEENKDSLIVKNTDLAIDIIYSDNALIEMKRNNERLTQNIYYYTYLISSNGFVVFN